jgi:hypothetical protein
MYNKLNIPITCGVLSNKTKHISPRSARCVLCLLIHTTDNKQEKRNGCAIYKMRKRRRKNSSIPFLRERVIDYYLPSCKFRPDITLHTHESISNRIKSESMNSFSFFSFLFNKTRKGTFFIHECRLNKFLMWRKLERDKSLSRNDKNKSAEREKETNFSDFFMEAMEGRGRREKPLIARWQNLCNVKEQQERHVCSEKET